jgi:phospholipase C
MGSAPAGMPTARPFRNGGDMTNGSGLGSVNHVVVLMLENRSFDHMLGFLYDGQGNVSPADRQPMSGSRLSSNGSRPDAARIQSRSSDSSAGRRPTVRRASRSSRIDAVTLMPSVVAM